MLSNYALADPTALNIKVHSILLSLPLEYSIVGLIHLPSETVVGATFANKKFNVYALKYCYYIDLIVAPGHANRPQLLPPTLEKLSASADSDIGGFAIIRRNTKISDKVLRRYGFTKQKNQVFFRPF